MPFSKVLAIAILGCICTSAVGWAQEDSIDQHLTVLFTTDLYGRFGEVRCGKEHSGADFANLVSAIEGIRQEKQQAGQPLPLVLNGGDNIGPHAFSRFLLSRGASGASLLTGWLKSAGYELIALGNQDFYSVPARLRAYLEAGTQAGLTFAACNLDCAESDKGLCPYIGAGPKRYVMLERAGLKIAVLSVIHGNLAIDVPPVNMTGIKAADPLKRAGEVVKQARQDGADLVLVLSHLDNSDTSPRHALDLARSVPEADLIIANGFASVEGQRGIGIIRFSDGATPIVGSDLFGQHLGRADLVVTKDGNRVRIRSLQAAEVDPSKAEADPAVRKEIRAQLDSYCADWDKPVGGARLLKPMQAAEFEKYLMEIMRRQTSSELAFINQGLVNHRTVFPLEGGVTRHDFFSALPHRNTVFTFELNVEELTKLCSTLGQDKAAGASGLLAQGLKCGDKITVNGRALESGESYQAVTIEYLAKGMLGYFKDQSKKMVLFHPESRDEAPVLGALARGFLSQPRFSGPQGEPVDLKANFTDLSKKLRWNFRGTLNLNLADTRIENDPAYEESQLTRDEFIALKTELRGKIAASSSFHAFSAEGWMKYARSSTNDQEFVESEDLTTVNLLYKLNALKQESSGWWVPALYLEGKGETELTKPDEGREYHHLELTGTVGARFALLATLEAKIGVGVRQEMLDESADPVYGIDVGYELVRTDLFALMGSPFSVESRFSAFFGDVGRSNTLKGQWTNRIYFALVGPIFFNVTHELFMFRYSDRDYGLASDLTFGLSYHARAAVQTF